MERLGPDTLAIFWSAPTRVYSRDVDYEYRQDSNFFYLTGIDQPESILILMPGNSTQREMLFVRDADPRREHREGHSLTPAEASAESGMATVMPTSQFDAFVAAMFSKRASGGAPGEYERFFTALTDGRAKLSMLLEPQPTATSPPGPARQFAASLRDRFFGFTVHDATPILNELRQMKTPYEQGVLRRSVAISSDAHKAGMREAAPGKFEYQVEAAIEAVYLRNGAMSWGYPSIVGSGPNATILHYSQSSRRMEPSDLLLVDAAGSYQGYTGDITRTYPVSGTFTREQREIYEIVLAAQEAGIKAAKAGSRFADIQAACDDVLRAGLVRLGLVVDPAGQQFKIWSTHGVSHWIGLDVHDVGVPRPLAPGMTFVIEPGIYIREAALDNSAEHAGERGLHQQGASGRAEVPEHRRADRGLVPPDRERARTHVRKRTANRGRDRSVHAEEVGIGVTSRAGRLRDALSAALRAPPGLQPGHCPSRAHSEPT